MTSKAAPADANEHITHILAKHVAKLLLIAQTYTLDIQPALPGSRSLAPRSTAINNCLMAGYGWVYYAVKACESFEWRAKLVTSWNLSALSPDDIVP